MEWGMEIPRREWYLHQKRRGPNKSPISSLISAKKLEVDRTNTRIVLAATVYMYLWLTVGAGST